MRLLAGCLLVLTTLIYLQSERHDCSLRGMSVDNYILCIAR